MQSNRLNLLLGLGVFVVAALACSASTANLSSLKVGKDKTVAQEASSFAPNDTVYAVAEVSNAPGAVKVTGRLVSEGIEGVPDGPIAGLEKTLDLPGSGTATYTFTPPPSGWPPGKYKLEAVMLNEAGEQKDQKSASFTVGG